MSSSLHRQLLITFSGLDGCGKSTQIEYLRSYLGGHNLTVKVLAFWDDVVVFSRVREGFVHKAFGSERGIGAPGRPVQRRDKNVRKWYLSLVRHALYLLDGLHLVTVIATARRSGADVIIMDRYIYDELANLPLSNPLTRVFVRMVAAMVPRPDLAYLLDADPESARSRKPEYPTDFLRLWRGAYLTLARMLKEFTVILPLELPQARSAVENACAAVLEANRENAGWPTEEARYLRP